MRSLVDHSGLIPARPCSRALLLLLLGLLGACEKPPVPVSVVVKPHAVLEDVADAVDASGLASARAFLERARTASPGVGAELLPGYLAPGTYSVERKDGVDGLLAQLVKAQQAVVQSARQGATWEVKDPAALALACVVDAEASQPAERELVAGVLAARAKRGWSLVDGNPLPTLPTCTPSPEALGAVFHAKGDALVYFHEADGRPTLGLAAEEQQALASIKADPAPPAITRGIHYFRSNELEPEQYRAPLLSRGGVHLGVGSEQNYTMLGWSRAELAILMDFDGVIPDLHGAFRVSFLESPTAAEMMALWQPANRKHFEELLTKHYPDEKVRAPILAAWKAGGDRVGAQLKDVAAHFQAVNQSCFLTSEEEYAHVVALYRANRVLRIRGDLTAKETLRGVGETLAKFRRVLRVLYTSNAEEYFEFTKDYKANIQGLPGDGRSVVLHTVRSGEDYTYITQGLDNFRAWLAIPDVKTVEALVPPRAQRRSLVYLDLTSTPSARGSLANTPLVQRKEELNMVTLKNASALARNVGQRLVLVGTAQDAKLGAVVMVESQPVYLVGVASWPATASGKTVRVTGTLKHKKLAPEPAVGPNGEQSTGQVGDSLVLEAPKWSVDH